MCVLLWLCVCVCLMRAFFCDFRCEIAWLVFFYVLRVFVWFMCVCVSVFIHVHCSCDCDLLYGDMCCLMCLFVFVCFLLLKVLM